MTKYFNLNYWVSNGGDGSANVQFVESEEEAEKEDEDQDEGWGESSAGSQRLKLEDGRLYFQDYKTIDGKDQAVWIEVKEG